MKSRDFAKGLKEIFAKSAISRISRKQNETNPDQGLHEWERSIKVKWTLADATVYEARCCGRDAADSLKPSQTLALDSAADPTIVSKKPQLLHSYSDLYILDLFSMFC
jgi:hypothetical protein